MMSHLIGRVYYTLFGKQKCTAKNIPNHPYTTNKLTYQLILIKNPSLSSNSFAISKISIIRPLAALISASNITAPALPQQASESLPRSSSHSWDFWPQTAKPRRALAR